MVLKKEDLDAVEFMEMIKISNKFLLKDDKWADKKMKNRRNKRKFVYPRGKTKSMFR